MAQTKKPARGRRSSEKPTGLNGFGEVMTLAEAARYLRVAEEDIVRQIEEQALPARRVGPEWRFLKSALEDWLAQRSPGRKPAGIWAAAGALKGDPYLNEMLDEIERMRGRPVEDG